MSWRNVLGSVAWAAALALVVALVQGKSQVLSVEIWLAAFALWMAKSILQELVGVTPVVSIPRLAALRYRSRVNEDPDMTRPHSLQSLHGLISRSCYNGRVHRKRLRPRLRSLAAHQLSIHRGINIEQRPDLAAAVLGDVAWVIDADATDRVPTLSELQQLVDVISERPQLVMPTR